jgi:uncharacterized protein (DUF4213/DUF364 family)
MENQDSSADVFIDVILDAARKTRRADLLDIRIGAFWTVVHTSIGAGMASSLRSESHLHGTQPIADAGRLDECSPLELAALMRSESVAEAAIGLAAANALLASTVKGLTEEKAVSILRERGAGKRVAMIGHFPFAEELRESCDELVVFERRLNRRDGDLGEEAIGHLLPDADVVAVTATTLLNRTLPNVLAGVRDDAFVMLLGPSTPLTPTLHRFGFDVLCGTIIDDPVGVLRAVEQGAVTSQVTGVRRVCLWRKS